MKLETMDLGSNNFFDVRSIMSGKLNVIGNNNKIYIGENCTGEIFVHIEGDNNTIEVNDFCVVRQTYIEVIRNSGCCLRIGSQSTIGDGGSFHFNEKENISIGVDCMISVGVYFSVSDMHPIFDKKSGDRINHPKDITIGDHVWIGKECHINKGSIIGSGSIIGTRSVVSKQIPEECLAIGVPAKVVREGVTWARDF